MPLVPGPDAAPAAWVVAGVSPFDAYAVSSLVPRGFAGYARVFHPAHRLVDQENEGSQERREVRWADVARANGRRAHPAMEWASLTGDWRFLDEGGQPGLWDEPPARGSLPLGPAGHLAAVLAAHTSTPDRCWFGVWVGWGSLAVPEAARIELPQRPMRLLSGPVSAVTTSMTAPRDQRASLWWPADRAWCVATDVDLLTTYVGGTAETIAAVTAHAALEALPVSPDQRVTWDSDTVNPPPRGAP
jgi:hypothetical protein